MQSGPQQEEEQKLQQEDQQQGPQGLSSSRSINTAALASPWWLTSLQLLAVQPACLHTHLPHQPLQQLAPELPLAGQHNLLLHLEAQLAAGPATAGISSAATAVTCSTEHVTTEAVPATAAIEPPLPLSAAVLEVVVLAHNMQQLLQQQVSLQQLLLSQQPELAAAQHGQSDSSSSCVPRAVGVNIKMAFPNVPSNRSLDALQLLVLVQQENIAGGSSSPPLLVAALPILLMPAAAQQEVQQLLLPAMRQDAQAALIAQQQPDQPPPQLSAGDLAQQVMQVESVVWKHFSQMAQDIYILLQVAQQAELVAAGADAIAGAGGGAGAGTGAEAAGVAAQAAAVPAAAQAEALVAQCQPPQAPSQYSTSTAVLDLASSADAAATPLLILDHLAQTMLFPLLLPFLAAHGVHNTLRLLLDQLPHQLQQVWHQQQAARLGALLAADETLQQLPLPDLQQEGGRAASAASHSASSGSDSGTSCNCEVQSGAARRLVAVSRQQQGPQQQMAPVAAVGGAGQAVQGAAAGGAAVAAVAEDVPWYQPFVGFTDDVEQRYLDWKHHTLLHLDYFAGMFGILYLLVLFWKMLKEPTTLFYVLHIIAKMSPQVPLLLGLRESYLRVRACSWCGAPDCPGPVAPPPWHRELWLFLVAPTCLAIGPLCLLAHRLLHWQSVPALLTSRALHAYWRGRGELITSAMRPIMQHMRIKPYLAYLVIDTTMSVWVFGQVYGYTAAASRWGVAAGLSTGLCWGLELYMRRLFVNRQQAVQQVRPTDVAQSSSSPLKSKNKLE